VDVCGKCKRIRIRIRRFFYGSWLADILIFGGSRFAFAAGQGNGNGADPIESNRIGRDFRRHSAIGVAKRGSGDWDVRIHVYLTKFMVDKAISDGLQNT